ncbi:MAG: hypothetical protein ACYCVB_04750 [Bacilli bacterium]
MQQQVSQQLQRVNQLCADAANLCQQAMREMQGVQQSVASTTAYNYQSNSSYQPAYSSYQTSGYGSSGSGFGTVMNADRQASQNENTPSYRNYNAQAQAYRPAQSANYTASVNPSAIQSVMSADRSSSGAGMASQAFGSSYGASSMTSSYGGGYGAQSAGAQSTGMQAAGMQSAGMQAAGMQSAGMQAAGMQSAGMQAAGNYQSAGAYSAINSVMQADQQSASM